MLLSSVAAGSCRHHGLRLADLVARRENIGPSAGNGERLALSVAEGQDVRRLPGDEGANLVAALVNMLKRAHQIGVANGRRTVDVVGRCAEALAGVISDMVVTKPPGHIRRLELHRNVRGDHSALAAVL